MKKRKRLSNSSSKSTMKDVAELAGVSISSVSHYLNDTRPLSPRMRAKVGDAITELDFFPNAVARTLRNGQSKTIGFVISNLENTFYVRIAKGLEQVLNANGYKLVIVDSAELKEKEKENVLTLLQKGFDGLVLVATSPDCAYLETMVPEGYPLVFVDRQTDQHHLGDTILLSNHDAAERAVQYFLETGKHRIAFVALHYGRADQLDRTMQERLDGYMSALRKQGLEVDDDLIRCVPGEHQVPLESLRHAMIFHETRQMLSHTQVDAIICGNSLAAVGVYTYLLENNISVPKDVALLSFDDELWHNMTSPPISSLAQPSGEMGALAGQRILERLKNKQLTPETYRLDAELVLRKSC